MFEDGLGLRQSIWEYDAATDGKRFVDAVYTMMRCDETYDGTPIPGTSEVRHREPVFTNTSAHQFESLLRNTVLNSDLKCAWVDLA